MFKFARKHKIFQGEFQAGPFAAVFVLFLILFLFNTSLVYVPGLPLRLDQPGLMLKPHQTNTVVIDEQMNFIFKGRSFEEMADFASRLREETRTNKALRLLSIQAHPAVTNEVVQQVMNLARELKLMVDLPGGRVDLPVANSLVITSNRMITLAINMSGQIYFQNQVVPEDRLTAQLKAAMQQARQPLTLLILADKTVEYNLIIRVGAAARAVGIEQVLLATRPALLDPSS
jgi:biopolymer transport protein ExbD